MSEYVVGQRWVSQSEAQLGLGIITDVGGRRVSVSFPAAGEERTYSSDNAPLSRVQYKPGDSIITMDDIELHVTAVEELRGLLFYLTEDAQGQELTLPELELSCFIQFTSPLQRLFTGHFDKLPQYELRVETLQHLNQLQQSPVAGLLGSRTSLLPHQVYIASEVAKRYAPRVLLADEVGLGKTIEAGMILHQQLITGLATRVLIVVPETLVHQWLIEMLRRFNLHFAIFDQQRWEALSGLASNEDYPEDVELYPEENADSTALNPFETEQLILCSIDFLMQNEQAQQQLNDCDWDLLVVDEAHHLQWSETAASPQYRAIEQLALRSLGLLLLTATPEQVGIESHFARLRLLDPSRFYDVEEFKNEEAGYRELSELVSALDEFPEQVDDAQLRAKIEAALGEEIDAQHGSELSAKLLDRHGTGRVLFRNTRAAIEGFPQRKLNGYPLETPEIYQQLHLENKDPDALLHPENFVDEQAWLQQDPRVQWLVEQLQAVRPDKILVIAAKSSTAIALEKHLRLSHGISSAVFHEGLSIVERDRAAAYFADIDEGAQTLICSEIGSEGRNFQFARHLVLFDLPLNPDLLEQRIGRLDRIGQLHTIQIHAPYLQDTAQATLFNWYHRGINAFESSCPAGFAIFQKFSDRLIPQLQHADTGLETLIADTAAFTLATEQAMHEGRDKLLERNSCNEELAADLITAIEANENSFVLEGYMTRVFDQFGVEHEFHSEYAQIIRPSEHMYTSQFPGLRDEGSTVTYNRQKALSREDMEFLSWEHPMVHDAIEMIQSSEFGNASLAQIKVNGIKPGTLLLESFFTLQCVAPKQLQLTRYLPISPIRTFVDTNGKDLASVISHEGLNSLCQKIPRNTALAIIKQIRDEVEQLHQYGLAQAQAQMPPVIDAAKTKLRDTLEAEIDRLMDLQKVNPNIRNQEIEFFQDSLSQSMGIIDHTSLQLNAIRIVVAT